MPATVVDRKLRLRRMAERSTTVFCREILDMTWSKDEISGEIHKTTFNEDGTFKDQHGVLTEGPHKEMCQFLDDEEHDNPELRKHIEMPRGSFKTSILQGYMMRRVLKDRNLRVLYGMETYTEAKQKLNYMKQQFEQNAVIRDLWGDVCGTPWGLDSGFTLKGRTILRPEPSFCGFGVDKNKTGGHFDIIVPDDLVTKDNIKSPTGIEKVLSTFNGLFFLLDPGGVMAPTGTRYGDEDLYGHILANLPSFKKLIIDCGMDLVTDELDQVVLEGSAKFKHLTEAFLLKQLRELDDVGLFSSQYLNQCLSSAMMIFKRSQFLTMDWKDWMHHLSYYVLTDTAVSEKDEGCFSTFWLVGLDSQDNAYVVDGNMGHWDPVNFVNELCLFQEQWESQVTIKRTLLEKVTMNAVFRPMIEAEARRRGLRMNLEDVPRGSSSDSKNQRISRTSGRFNRRAITWVTTIRKTFQDLGRTEILFDPEGYGSGQGRMPGGEIVDQYVRFPSYPKNDGPDALADIDALDAKGRRICVPGSYRAEQAWKQARRRSGDVIPMRIMEDGRPVWVDVRTNQGHTSDPEPWIERYRRERGE